MNQVRHHLGSLSLPALAWLQAFLVERDGLDSRVCCFRKQVEHYSKLAKRKRAGQHVKRGSSQDEEGVLHIASFYKNVRVERTQKAKKSRKLGRKSRLRAAHGTPYTLNLGEQGVHHAV